MTGKFYVYGDSLLKATVPDEQFHYHFHAAEQQVPLIPVRRAFLWDQNYCRMISPDGIHLNMTGYRRLFDTIGQWAQEHLT